MSSKKSLIAYYSRRGQNCKGGSIVSLEEGNTEVIAKMIQKITDSDIFHIDTIKPYPEDYSETTQKAKVELNENARPELKNHIENIDDYDLIFLGFPNWWSTMPMAVFTFLEEYDFTNKTIVPFCTHGGGGFGSSIRDIEKIVPNVTIKEGLDINGSDVNNSEDKVSKWLKTIL